MKITRHGTDKHRGEKHIQLDKPIIGWDALKRCVTVRQKRIPPFVAEGQSTVDLSRYDYTVSLSLDEVGAVLNAVCTALKNKKGRVV